MPGLFLFAVPDPNQKQIPTQAGVIRIECRIHVRNQGGTTAQNRPWRTSVRQGFLFSGRSVTSGFKK